MKQKINIKAYKYVKEVIKDASLEISEKPFAWSEHNGRCNYMVTPQIGVGESNPHKGVIYALKVVLVETDTRAITTANMNVSEFDQIFASMDGAKHYDLKQHVLDYMFKYMGNDAMSIQRFRGAFNAVTTEISDIIEVAELKVDTDINGDSDAKLNKIGFQRIINLNPNPHGVSYAYRNGGIMLYPIYEKNNDNDLYFEWECGRTHIKTEAQAVALCNMLR